MRAFLGSPRFLSVYSGVLTVVFALTVVIGATGIRKQSFDEIEVGRIDVVEPDGTTRLVLSSKASFPGLVFKGTEYEHPTRQTAGILFYNDEGTEAGGLVFGGETDADGKVSAYGHLSFDQYEQDQVVTLNATESDGNRKAGMSVWDRPEYSTVELLQLAERVKDLPGAEQDAAFSEFFAEHESAHPRLYLGKSHDGSVSLRLNDGEGRERLVIEVAADGAPAVRVLDEQGEEIARFPETKH